MSISVFEFGDYRLDASRFELYRAGRALKLERKPMELLILLAASDGRLLTRDEIASRLWEREVFVDTEHGINTAVRKIRLALRDDAEQPRFLQTVTGKGYRFIATIEHREAAIPIAAAEPATADLPAAPSEPVEPVAFAKDIQPDEEVAGSETIIPDIEPPPAARAGGRRMWTYGLVAAALLIATLGFLATRRVHPKDAGAVPNLKSIAVLPFENFSRDPGQDYLAEGVTDELITQLAKHSTLRVVSRTSVMQFKGSRPPMSEVARRLGVDGILEGSIARSGSNVHCNLQLIEASTDTHVWAETYDRNADDLVSFPRDASVSIAERLHRVASHAPPDRPVLPAAHDAYLRGRDLWFKEQDALPYFRKAIELQPDYALGWSGLSVYYGAGVVTGQLSPAESLDAELSAAQKAVELDDSSPEAHLALGSSYFIVRSDAVSADREILRAIELDPKFAEAHHFRAKMLAAFNRHDEAIHEQEIAIELDPFGRPWALALSYMVARQFDRAMREAKLRLEQLPHDGNLLALLSDAYHRLGRDRESAEVLAQEASQDPNGAANAAEIRTAFARKGFVGLVERRLAINKELSKTQYVSPVRLADSYGELGRREETLASLEAAYRERSPLLLWMQNRPQYDFLHQDPRYRAIVKAMHLPLD